MHCWVYNKWRLLRLCCWGKTLGSIQVRQALDWSLTHKLNALLLAVLAAVINR